MTGDGEEVVGHVAGLRCPPMNTTDTAGGEHGHTGAGGERHRRRHGGDTDVECGGVGVTEISGGDLRGAAEHPLDLVVGDTDHRNTVEHGGHRRDGAGRSDHGVAALQTFEVGGFGKAEGAVDRGFHATTGTPSATAEATSSPTRKIVCNIGFRLGASGGRRLPVRLSMPP